MNKSNINELSAQTEADSNSTAQNQQSSQPNANTNVVCQGGRSFKEIANKVMLLNHVGIQSDDIHYNEELHQTLRLIDKLNRYDAVRLLMHIIHVQQLQLVGAEIKYSEDNPFKDMVNFDYIDSYIKCYSPEMETLY